MVAGATVAPLSGAAVVNDVTNEPQKRASDNRRVSCIKFYITSKIYFPKKKFTFIYNKILKFNIRKKMLK